MKTVKKALALLLALCMLFSLGGMTALAEEVESAPAAASGGGDTGGGDSGGGGAPATSSGGGSTGGGDVGGSTGGDDVSGSSGGDVGGSTGGDVSGSSGGGDVGGSIGGDVGGSTEGGQGNISGETKGGVSGNSVLPVAVGTLAAAKTASLMNTPLLTTGGEAGNDSSSGQNNSPDNGNDSNSQDSNGSVSYQYNAGLYDPDSGKYPGVYSTKITPQSETVTTAETIGMPSIADANLPDAPTTESPAIIQGAAVGYENRISPTEYQTIEERPEPYSEFRVKITEQQGSDGTMQKKPTGFDGTYVIVRLDVSQFLTAGSEAASGSGSDTLYLHMEQKDNKALMAAATVAKGTAGAQAEDYTPTNSFTDSLGNRSASYKLSDLVDPNETTPYLDVILYATSSIVAGADTASTVQGDVPLALYVDNQLDYRDNLNGYSSTTEYDPSNTANVDPNAKTDDPNAKTAQKYTDAWHSVFFDKNKVASTSVISNYLVKGSDLKLETMVENSGGDNKDTGTTYWSLQKSMVHEYYDQEIDKSADDPGSGRTVKMMSEVAVTDELDLIGTDENNLKKRTLDVNSYDVQIANNQTTDTQTYSDGIKLQNAWLTITDNSNTTGAEMAIGNNAKFTIDQGGKLIISDKCQLEIEWDGATTTPSADGSTTQEPILNNGQLNLLKGGEIVNNGIITIEGQEGKPVQPASGQTTPSTPSEKGQGEMTIDEGAKITNNGALLVYGSLRNNGTLVNNGKYSDVIASNDPDKGAFNYHKGIQVAWKDDVTQTNYATGTLTNGTTGELINNGDILLAPGTLNNEGNLTNSKGANIYSAAVTEAVIPITPDPNNPTVVTKRIVLDHVEVSKIINSGTLTNYGNIGAATVTLLDNTGAFNLLFSPGAHPELFTLKNTGTINNYGTINEYPTPDLAAVFAGSAETINDTWLYLYEDGSFLMLLPNGERVTGTYEFVDGMLVFTVDDGTIVEPVMDADGNWAYSFTTPLGYDFEFVLSAEFVSQMMQQYGQLVRE